MRGRGALVADAPSLAMLAATGQLPWLRAWLGGGARAALHELEEGGWAGMPGPMLVVAGERALARAGLLLGRRWQVRDDGARALIGAQEVPLADPARTGWLLPLAGGGHVLLAPPGDFVFARAWVEPLLGGLPALAAWAADGGDEIEPGVVLAREAPSGEAVRLAAEPVPPEEVLLARLRARGLRLRTAESCTAGMLAARIARVPGASDVLERGWVVYANAAKEEELGVPRAVLAAHGAVSREVVEAMARAGADDETVCVAISGVAGPGGGTPDKPVGTVWIAAALGDAVTAGRFAFPGGRNEVRARATVRAMALVQRLLAASGGV